MGILDDTLITIERPNCKVVSPEKIGKEIKVKNPPFIMQLAGRVVGDEYNDNSLLKSLDKSLNNAFGRIGLIDTTLNKYQKTLRQKNDGMGR